MVDIRTTPTGVISYHWPPWQIIQTIINIISIAKKPHGKISADWFQESPFIGSVNNLKKQSQGETNMVHRNNRNRYHKNQMKNVHSWECK